MTLEEMVSQLRKLGAKDVEIAMGREGAIALEETLRATLAAGTTPEGAEWAPRKEDGGRPYAGAVRTLTVQAYGNLIRATITGPEAYGHLGLKKMVRRPMLPDAGGGIPKSVEKALQKAAAKVFEGLTK